MSAGQSAETAAAVPSAPRVLYSSGQIALTAFLLGPLPPLYMLISNFRTLGQARLLRMAAVGGYALLMAEIFFIYFIPRHSIVGTILAPINAGMGAGLAHMYQPDAATLSRTPGLTRASLWRVAWVWVVRTLEFLIWVFFVFSLLDYAGFSRAR
ncbi:MAG TPA: hypothetical protein VGN70_11365 [Gammaproteobacteria bacterium]|jgi:hypothetical protein